MADLSQLRVATGRRLFLHVLDVLRRHPWVVVAAAMSNAMSPDADRVDLAEQTVRYGAAGLLTAAVYLQLAETLAARRQGAPLSADGRTVLSVVVMVALIEMTPLAILWNVLSEPLTLWVGRIGRDLVLAALFTLVAALGWALFGPRVFRQFAGSARKDAAPGLETRFAWLFALPFAFLLLSTASHWLGEAARLAAASVPGFSGDLAPNSVWRIALATLWGLSSVSGSILVAGSLASILVILLYLIGALETDKPSIPAQAIMSERAAFSAVLAHTWPAPALLYALLWASRDMAAVIANWREVRPETAETILWIALLSLAGAAIALLARRRLGRPTQWDGSAPLLICLIAIFSAGAFFGATAEAWGREAASGSHSALALLWPSALGQIVAALTILGCTAVLGPTAIRFLTPSRTEPSSPRRPRLAPGAVVASTLALLALGWFSTRSGPIMHVLIFDARGAAGQHSAGVAQTLLEIWSSAGAQIGLALYYVAFLYAIVALTWREATPEPPE